MAVAFTELVSNGDNSDLTTYTTSSVTLTTGRLYVAFILAETAGSAQTISTMATHTGGTISFTKITNLTWGGSSVQDFGIFRALPSSTVTDTIDITMSGAMQGASWSIFEITGMDTSGSNGSGAIVQSNTGKGNTTTITVTLSSNITAGNSRLAAGGATENVASQPVLTSGTWTTVTQVRHSLPSRELWAAYNVAPATTDKSVIVTPSASAQIVGGIVEIKAAAADQVGFIPIF